MINRLFKEAQPIIWVLTTVIIILLWLYNSFMTKEAMSKERDSIIQYVDSRHDLSKKDLEYLKNTTDRLETKTDKILEYIKK